jgi:hypothetical protein
VRAHYGVLRLASSKSYQCVLRWRLRLESSAAEATSADASLWKAPVGIWEYEVPGASEPVASGSEAPLQHGEITIALCSAGYRYTELCSDGQPIEAPLVRCQEGWWSAHPNERHPGIYLRRARAPNTLELRCAEESMFEAVRRPSAAAPSRRSMGWGTTPERALWSAMHRVVLQHQ